MKYRLLDNNLEVCWPNIYDDDIDWFRNQKDILNEKDRLDVEKLWSKIKYSENRNDIFNTINDIFDILKKYKHITVVTFNCIKYFMKLYDIELKLRERSNKQTIYNIEKEHLKNFNVFLKDGVLPLKVREDLYEKLYDNLKNKVEKLKNLPREEVRVLERGYTIERATGVDKEGLNIIDMIAKDLQIYSYIRTYYNCEFKLTGARLHCSTDEDQHCVQTLNDLVKDNPPRHKNLHIDPELNIKCIIYLKDVSQKDGPFSYIKGSHLFGKTSMLEKNFAKAINVYNINNTPEKRLEFLSLPKDLHKSANFGNYILNDSKNGKFIKNNLTPITSDLGNFILFDPDGIHLGGNCYEGGNRIAIQAIFKQII